MSTETENQNITVTVRLIRSFVHRNIKHLVYHNVNANQKVEDFIAMINKDIPMRRELPPPFKKYSFDTLKISHKAYGAKTIDPVINTGNDDTLILSTVKSLAECGIENETELSYFKLEDYREYQKNPTLVF